MEQMAMAGSILITAQVLGLWVCGSFDTAGAWSSTARNL
jgi:hypothetical protein